MVDLEAPSFAYTCMLTSYVHLPIFIQILNILDLHFQGQRYESNTLVRYTEMHSSLYRHDGDGEDKLYQSPRCQGVSGVEADYNYRQYMSRGVSLDWILSKMQPIAFSPIAFGRVSVYVYVCPFKFLIGGTHNKQFEINQQFFIIGYAIKLPGWRIRRHCSSWYWPTFWRS